MASKEFIEKRIEGKKAEIAKLEKKLERINKAKETNWEVNPYYYGEADLRYTTNELNLAKDALVKYEQQLAQEIEKDNSRDVEVILEFLEQWKKRQYEFYTHWLRDYYDEKDAVRDMWRALNDKYKHSYLIPDEEQAKYEEVRDAFYEKCNGRYDEVEAKDYFGHMRKHKVKVEDGEYEFLDSYTRRCPTYFEAEIMLKKELDEEAKRKYDFIIERVNAICGTITDASNLKIGATGELNGNIIGDRGTASVKTIGAGGYNDDIIVNERHGQRFHFRTLIHKVKEGK